MAIDSIKELEAKVTEAWNEFRPANALPEKDISEILIDLTNETPQRSDLLQKVNGFYDDLTYIENVKMVAAKYKVGGND